MIQSGSTDYDSTNKFIALRYNSWGALTKDESRGITDISYDRFGNPTGGQPYKFGGKELVTANGLNEYDFGARQYYSAVPAFNRFVPMAACLNL